MLEHLDTVIAFATVMLMLSLLVTTIVQMVSAVLGMRGRNLYWGVKRLLEQIDPDLGKNAKEIADRLLHHPSVTHSRMRAEAIRKEELVRLLTDMSAAVRLPDPPFRKKVRDFLASTITNVTLRKWLDRLLVRPLAWLFPHPARPLILSQEAKDAIAGLLARQTPGATAEEVARVQGVAASLSDLLPSQAQAVQSVVDRVLAQTNKLAAETNSWFDTVMDRTSERFKLHTRYITIVVAVLFALSLQVNSLTMLDQLSKDKDLRAQLVGMSDSVLKQGDQVLAPEGSELATKAIRHLATDQSQPEIAAAVAKLCPSGKDDNCARLTTRLEGRTFLQKGLAPGDQPEGLMKSYDDAYTDATKARLNELGVSFATLQDYLAGTRLQIIPEPIPKVGDFNGGRNFLGIVMTAFFLSLGAPFWYNALRKLSDLRPIVARRVDGEPLKGAPKK